MVSVSGLWVGPSLSPLERACIASFLQHGHQFELYVYEPVAGVPDGCRLEDAASILPAERVFVHADGEAQGSVAAFADVFRYEVLHRRGGWWVDLDIFCLSPALPDAGFVIGRQNRNVINGAILRAPAQHPLIAAAREACRNSSADIAWGEFGPDLLTRLMDEQGLRGEAFPPNVFYPIDWQHYWAIVDPRRSADVLRRMQSATCIHLWNEMFRRVGFDKNVLPPEGSVLRGLYESVIDTAGFAAEYVLPRDCAANAFRLEIRARPV